MPVSNDNRCMTRSLAEDGRSAVAYRQLHALARPGMQAVNQPASVTTFKSPTITAD